MSEKEIHKALSSISKYDFAFISNGLVEQLGTWNIKDLGGNKRIYSCGNDAREGEDVKLIFLCLRKDFVDDIYNNGTLVSADINGVEINTPDLHIESDLTVGELKKFLSRVPEELNDLPVKNKFGDAECHTINEVAFIETMHCDLKVCDIDCRSACYVIPAAGCTRGEDICGSKACKYFNNLKCKDFKRYTALSLY